MASTCELSINVVTKNRPNHAERSDSSGSRGFQVPWRGHPTLPAEREGLTHSVVYPERGKPVALPRGKADRKGSRWGCGYGRPEEANAAL